MAKICDKKSVGLIAELDGRYAMIYRKNYPVCWAMIAGHVDEHGDERRAVIEEAREEGGLVLGRFIEVFRASIDNPCKRLGGDRHEWVVYEAYDWAGQLTAGSDATEVAWKTQEELQVSAKRTEYFMEKYGIRFEEVGKLTLAIFGNPQSEERKTDPEWESDPGLEPVWYYILKNLNKI